MTRKVLFLLALGTLVVFSLLGWIITEYFGPYSLETILRQGETMYRQVVLGLVMGSLIGVLAWILVNQPFLESTRNFFVEIIGPWKLSWVEVILVSCCAGIGEEILFRGAIQPHFGILWTSIIFVVLHGYINPFSGPMTVYGVFMILAIYLLGWAAIQYGLWVAIVAHTVIDIILLYKLSKAYKIKVQDIPLE